MFVLHEIWRRNQCLTREKIENIFELSFKRVKISTENVGSLSNSVLEELRGLE